MNKQIVKLIKSYFKKKPEVIAVYLFGSHARSIEHRSSDIDIGILLKEEHRYNALEKRIDYMIALSKLSRKDIHPVILNFASEELVRQIFLKGKCILVNKARELSEYKMIMITKIADFTYYRNQIQSGFVNKVMEG
jgi:predicted nucleotidyltransferase